MAIINNNVQNVKFLRNGSLFGTHDLAYSALTGFTLTAEQDGTIILARYGSGDNVKTLAGLVYAKDANKSITIIDIEGASADVEELRREINAKLGTTFISSGNTVEANLTALSGTSSDASGVTSVWGAKAYADAKISELDSPDTAVAGEYVSQVTQADGKIAVTRVELPSLVEVHADGKPIIAVAEDKGQLAASAGTINAEFVNVTGGTLTATTVQGALEEIDSEYKAAIENLDYTDTAVTKQFVAAVDESNGVVSITRGEIESSGKTIVLTADGNDVNFEVNIDGVTLEKDANGVISVTSSALVQYEGDDDTIQIGAVQEGKRIVSSPLTIQKVTTGLSEEVKEEYHLIGHSGTTIGDPVKIYKDSHIVSIEYQNDPDEAHYQNLIYTYVDVSGNTQEAYVDISELVLEAEFASGVTATEHVVHGVVDPTSESFLTVGAGGFKLAGVQGAITSAVEALDLTDDTAVAGQYVAAIEETDGIVGVKTRANVSEAVLNNYSKGSASGAVASTDTINEAISKIEVRLDGELAALDATVSGETSDGKVNVKVTEEDGVITAVNVVGSDIASANALDAEITARKAVDGQDGQTYAANSGKAYISGATSLNDADIKLNDALASLDADVIKSVKVNNVALAETSNAVNVQISSVKASGTDASPIVVNTNESTGAVTLQILQIDCGEY